MPTLSTKKVIGITGGIASGKSTLDQWLRQKGYCVIDADKEAKKLQAKGGPLYEALVQHFGEEILEETGELDRPKLGKLLFSSSKAMADSAELQDGIIRHHLAQVRDQALKEHDLVFMDIPILIEKGYQDWFDEIWLVVVEPKIQLMRLMARNQLSEADARARIASQLSVDEKKQYADRLIDNNGGVSRLYTQIKQVLNDLLAKEGDHD